MSKVKIFIHKTCPTSLYLLKELKKLAIFSEIETIDVSEDPFQALRFYSISVPAVFKDDKLIDMGPIDVQKMAKFIAGTTVYEIGQNELEEIILDNLWLSNVGILNRRYWKDSRASECSKVYWSSQ